MTRDDIEHMAIEARFTASKILINPTQRIYGKTDAFAEMLTDVSRKFRYFVIEEVNGGVQIKFTNTNPEQDQPR